jgi:hypothetical protein
MPTDKQLVATKDYNEVSNVVAMLRRKNIGEEINRVTVKDVFWNGAGRSRIIAYAIFRLMGYNTAKAKGKVTKEHERKIKDIAQRMGL